MAWINLTTSLMENSRRTTKVNRRFVLWAPSLILISTHMKVSAKTVRTLFGFQAAFFVVMFGVFLYYVTRFSVVIRSGPFSPKYVFGAFLVLFIPCSLSGIAWYRLRYEIPSSRIWFILASLASLLFPVLGPATCILGLLVLCRKPPAPKQPPKYFPEDETNRYIENAVIAASIASWIAAAWYWHEWGERQALRPVYDYAWWVQLALAVFASVVIHELGHAMAGWLVRMKLLKLHVGPLDIQFEDGRPRYSFSAVGLIGGIGPAAMAPLDLSNIRSRLTFMAIGGPLASLLCAASCTVLTLSSKGSFWERGWEFFAIASACVIASP